VEYAITYAGNNYCSIVTNCCKLPQNATLPAAMAV
jgi:hypothetical protein